MGVLRRVARSQSVRTCLAAGLICTLSGCTGWMTNSSASDFWDRITPSSDTWEKWSPSNIWYKMQPSQLHKLNYEEGMPNDVYD
jgi:hypothetical protein